MSVFCPSHLQIQIADGVNPVLESDSDVVLKTGGFNLQENKFFSKGRLSNGVQLHTNIKVRNPLCFP